MHKELFLAAGNSSVRWEALLSLFILLFVVLMVIKIPLLVIKNEVLFGIHCGE
jgi:hypothetical protein